MDVRVKLQVAEALGPLNRWFCSEAHRREILEPELLVRHYVKKGGAHDFARRFNEAMSPENRWYCSEFYGREICDPEILWEYYKEYAPARAVGKARANQSQRADVELSVAR